VGYVVPRPQAPPFRLHPPNVSEDAPQ
jgi:hypothetical protein